MADLGLSEKKVKAARASQPTLYLRFGKRLFDTFVALVGLILAAPLLLLGAAVIRVESRGGVFFRQRRVGQHGKCFQIIKLRTMVDEADRRGLKLTASGDSRITMAGVWLRKTKLDEIPQLINVLRGEMSLVGPRPEVPEYVTAYSADQRGVLELKPGITGPASLAFIDEEKILARRSDRENFYVRTLLARKLDLDLAYCGAVSFLGDLRLILLTVGRLFSSDRANKVSQL